MDNRDGRIPPNCKECLSCRLPLRPPDVPLVYPEASIQERFRRLADEWKEQSRYLSNAAQMAMLKPYQRIIGLGLPVVPLILKELQREPDQWFWALESITEQDPVPPETEWSKSCDFNPYSSRRSTCPARWACLKPASSPRSSKASMTVAVVVVCPLMRTSSTAPTVAPFLERTAMALPPAVPLSSMTRPSLSFVVSAHLFGRKDEPIPVPDTCVLDLFCGRPTNSVPSRRLH